MAFDDVGRRCLKTSASPDTSPKKIKSNVFTVVLRFVNAQRVLILILRLSLFLLLLGSEFIFLLLSIFCDAYVLHFLFPTS